MTTSTITAEAVELEAEYVITYSPVSRRELHGYTLVRLLTDHRLPGGLLIVRIGDASA